MRVLIVDDSNVYRHALAVALAAEAPVEVVAEAAGPAEARLAVGAVRADVVLMTMANDTSIATLSALTEDADGVPVIAVFGHADVDLVACAEAGASGFVHRDDSFADLVGLLAGAARGETGCSPKVAATLLRAVASLAAERTDRSVPPNLTPREREVLHLLDEGLSNKQIARRLSIELRTVKNHVHHILEKCRVTGRHQAVAQLRAARLHNAWSRP
jgi:two-component system, NarL family, nitrate/nitrite response regulator NarL